MSRNLSYSRYFTLTFMFVIALYISGLIIPIKALEYSSPLFFGKFTGESFLTFAKPWQSVTAATLLLVATGLMLARFTDRYSTGYRYFVPMIFLILALSNPYSIYLSPFHVAAFLLVPVLNYFFYYEAAGQNVSHLFVSNFLMAIAVCFCPPLIWLAPVLLFSGIDLADDKLKYIFSFILSLAMPFGVVSAIIYLVYGIDTAMGVLPEFSARILDIGLDNLHISLATICKMATLTIFAIVSILTILKNLGRFKISKYKVYIRLIFILISTAVIAAVFSTGTRHPWSIIAAVPLSLVGNELYNAENVRVGKHTGILTMVIILIIIVERVTYFIK
ncbi:MAG: hypothetical protein KBS58_02720 [Bacteroidales bacterium]|nr:hypothetical protein [Candidatus Cacconaster equi]